MDKTLLDVKGKEDEQYTEILSRSPQYPSPGLLACF